jgi:hypothetical protein
MGLTHSVKNRSDEWLGYVNVEEIRHGVDKNARGASPGYGLREALRTQLEVEASLIRMTRYAPPPFCECLCVAVIATG